MAKKTVQELRESVLSYGFNTQRYGPLVNHWIDEAVRNMFRQAKLRRKTTEYEFETEPGVNKYELPENFGSSISLRDLEETSDKTLNRFINIEEFDDASSEEGIPYRYIINSNYIYLWPTPSTARKYSLRFNLLASSIAEEESANPDIGEDFYYLIEIYCLYKAFQKENDIEMANHYKAVYDTEMIEFVEEVGNDTKDSPEQVEGPWAPGAINAG